MRATIYDVAKRAQVSIATVSRVVSGHARVTEATRARVLEAVQELNYQPNPVAQGLALRSPRTLALIIERFDNMYPARIVAGVEEEARARGYHLLVQQLNDLDQASLIRIAARTDGVIMSGSASNEDHMRMLVEQGAPTVVLGNLIPGLQVDGVVCDNYGGASAATKHLIECGYRRIAHIAGPDTSRHGAERLRGYVETLEAHGIAPRDEYIVKGQYTPESGSEAMAQLLALPQPPDAVFCADDLMALGALLVLHQRGLSAPEQMGLIGFDGLDTGAFVTPPLTSVYQPMEEMGRVAVQTLLWRLANRDEEPRETVLPTELLIRGSCRCASSHRMGAAA